jgi:hypothetical protein
MKKLIFALLFSAVSVGVATAQQVPRYAVASTPVPVLNTPEFQRVFGGRLQLAPCNGVRPIEFIALTGTLFTVWQELEKDDVTVYRVTSNDYPYPSKTGYFVDARFLKPVSGAAKERPRTLPPLDEVRRRLAAGLGKPYVWGGNLQDGVPLLRALYPQADPLAGLDCSGLLYQATGGYTPRNTSALTSFGAGLPVAGLSPKQIAKKLQPLDLIVWKGHVMIVLDHDSIIQSTMGCRGGAAGVHLSPIEETLRQLMTRRRPVDRFPEGAAGARSFVVRRWLPGE